MALTIEPTATTRPAIDQVTAEVIRSGMETVCFEMATFVSRTATTPNTIPATLTPITMSGANQNNV